MSDASPNASTDVRCVMPVPSNDSPLWPLLRYAITLAAVGAWMHFGYKNGFDPAKDVPGLLVLLGAAGGAEFVQAKMSGSKKKDSGE